MTGSKGTTAKCGANKTNGQGTCGREAGWGTDHLGFGNCKNHGGSTPAGIVYASRVAQESKLLQYGGPIELDPHQALLNEVYRSAGHVQWLEDKVRLLTDGDMSEETIAGKVPNFWIRWYTDERMRLVNSAAVCIKAGVAERRVKIAEEQGRVLADAIRTILNELGLNADQQRKAPEIVRAVLQSVPVAA